MRTSIAVSIVLLLAAAGCNTEYFAMPNLLHPGSLARQRWQAEVFDPYPIDYLGTPVVGGRPPQYTTPTPEAEDNSGSLKNRFGPPPPKYSLESVP